MKKTKLLTVICIITVMVLSFGLSGCSIITNILDKLTGSGGSQLSTPTGLTLNDKELTWNAVDNADSYNVEVTVNNGSPKVYKSSTNSYKFDADLYGEISVRVSALSSKSKYKESEYSQALSTTLYVTLTIDESSVTINKQGDDLVVSFGAVAHADEYKFTYKKGAEAVQTRTSAIPGLTIENYDSDYTYRITFQAIGSGWYKSSQIYTHNKLAEADYSTATLETIDLKDGEAQSFSVEGFYELYINDAKVDSANLTVGAFKIEIPFDYLSDLSVGEYRIAVYDQYRVSCYVLTIKDTRDPLIDMPSSYLKDGVDVSGSVKQYATTFTSLQKSGVTVPSTAYSFNGSTLVLHTTYLNDLSVGTHTFTYNYTLDGVSKNVTFTMAIQKAVAELKKVDYIYTGLDSVELDISTHGDTITSIKGEKSYLTDTDYYTDRNRVVIYKTYLSAHSDVTFEISSALGLKQTFTIERRLDGFVPSQSLYNYDKATANPLVVTGTAHSSTIRVYGNNITTADYLFDESLKLKYDYLNGLSAGTYTFMVENDGTYSYFDVAIINTAATPQNVKFNFDISADVYVTFECDCGQNNHVYSVDSSSFAFASSPQKITSFTRNVDHTLTVKCGTCRTQTVYNYAHPDSEALSYMDTRITLLGESQDLYVDSYEELAFIMVYLAYGGDGYDTTDPEYPYGKIELDVYYSDNFNELRKSADNYLNTASAIANVSDVRYSVSVLGNKSTITAIYVGRPEADSRTGMTKTPVSDPRQFLSASARGNDYDDFKINQYTKTENILLESELAALPYGVKPVFIENNQAKQAYENALEVCRTYINDSMSDIDKVMTIYHWLTTKVTYDSNTLYLAMVQEQANATDSVSAFKSWLKTFVAEHSSISTIVEPLKNYNNMEDIRKYMDAKIGSLRAFELSGALIDNIAVCDGISKAFKLMCLIEGIQCEKVSGYGISSKSEKSGEQLSGESHAWNKVYIDGEWYVVDATWGRNNNYVNHAYFLIPEEKIISNHLEGVRSYGTPIIDVVAQGQYDFYANQTLTVAGKKYDMRADSKDEFKSTTQMLKMMGEKIIEIKLNFEYTDLGSVLIEAGLSGSYYVINGNILLMILN